MSDALQSKLNKLSQAEQAMLRLISDPVLWVEATLRNPEPGKGDQPIKLRPYQANILRHPSKRRVCRMGRRTGKCISRDALINTTQGQIRAEDLVCMNNKPPILTFDEIDLKVKETDKYLIWPNGVKPVYSLTTRLGRQTKITGNHPFCIINESGLIDWRELDDLREGDRIAVPSTYRDLIQGQAIDRGLARILGYLVGDGGTTERQIKFSNTDDVILNDFNLILADYSCELRKNGSSGCDYRISGIIPFKRGQHPIHELCRDHELSGKLALEKRVPEIIMGADKAGISEFIGAYWDCDGWVSISKNGHLEIGASTASEGLAHDLQHLLLRLGINASLRHKPVKYNGGIRNNWVIIICNRVDMIRFLNTVQMVLKDKRKDEILAIIEPRRNTSNSVQTTIPREINYYLDAIKGDMSDREIERSVGTRIRRAYSPSIDKLTKYAELFEDEYLLNLCNSDVIWDEVVSIEYVGEEETYDLSVCETHALIADDIISHNTSSMVMHIIWYAYTHRDSKQIIATPYQSQIDLIFDMIRQYIKSAPGLSSSIVRDIKNPSKIELSNGAIIRGFTAGTKNGDSGASLRGQAADWIYLDECLDGDTLIATENGLVAIRDIKVGDKVFSLADNGDLEKRTVIASRMTGYKETIRLNTSTGKELICTPNHPVLTDAGYLPAEEAGHILMPVEINYPMDRELILARLCGSILGDGWIYDSKKTVGFSGDMAGLELIKSDLQSIFGDQYNYRIHSRKTNSPRYGITGTTNSLAVGVQAYKLFKELGLPSGKKVEQPLYIPEFVLSGSDDTKREFLGGLFGAESCKTAFQKNGKTLKATRFVMYKNRELSNDHHRFMNDLMLLLSDLGIESNLYKQETGNSKTIQQSLVIANNDDNMIRFLEQIKFRYEPEKELSNERILLYLKDKARRNQNYAKMRQDALALHAENHSIKQICKQFNVSWNEAQLLVYKKPQRTILKSFPTYAEFLSSNFSGDYFKDSIENRQDAGIRPVYNLTVEGEHNYIANGLITHNCDYMNDSDIETISAIALDRPSIGIWASSTPSGRRGMFWKMCTGVIKKKIRDAVGKIIGEESAWHEFYHPSTENPNWNEDMEAEFRAMFTEVAYEHEVLAEFGEETIGVFKKILIDAARAEYTYDQARLSPKMGPRIMGVDWDKYADASQAVILEYNQSAKQFMVIHRHETPKSAFTLTNAVSRIIELNEEYRLDYIFVDRGYGEYQVETLHKYGLDNPSSGLHHKVRGVAFSEFKDIIDPHTKEIRSEPLKPFMVNTLLNILESYKLKISEYDEMIIRQMENYQVIKKTISGQPVYTSSDEHSLDCLMLCCLGFVEKYPEIIDDIFITRYANAIGRLSSDKDKEEKHPVQQAIDKIADEALAAIDVGKKPSVHKFNTRGTPRFRRTSF